MDDYNTANYEKASPSLLSKEPSDIETRSPDPKWQPLRGSLETRLVSLRNWRQSWWTQNWSDIAQFLLPRRSIWLTQSTGGSPSPNNMTRGRELNGAIADPTGTYALRVCSSGLMSGLASPSRPWFKIVPGVKKLELDTDARAWLDETEDRMYTVIAGSNFYNAFAVECEDVAAFGTAPNIIYEDDRDLIRCYNPTIGEYYLSSDSTGRIDGLYRLFVMTVSQMVGFFGVEDCPADVQELWKEKGNSLEVERTVAHAIEPNFEVEGFGKLPGKFTWREVYWCYGSNSGRPLEIRGFVDQPFTASRWTTQSNDAYGRSVGMEVLPDIMQLQVMTRRMAEAIEKQVRPPLIGSMELKNKPSSTLPGNLTYVSDVKNGGIRPIYEVNPDIGAMSANIQMIGQRIQKGFFNDLFLMLENQPNTPERMTAYEVAQKLQEKLQVLGPVIESLISESLKPKLKRIYNILKRKGMIDEPPDSLKGVPLDVEFVSMLALAQKGAATGGIERLMQIVGGMAPLVPTAIDNLDTDKIVRNYNELLGNPSSILRGPDEVASIRQEKAKQQQQEMQMQNTERMAQAAGAAAPAGKVLSDISPGGGQDVLGKLMGSS